MVNFDVRDKGFQHKEYKKYLMDGGVRIKEYNEDLKQYRLVIYPQIREREVERFVELTKKFLESIK
jgi:hypothetical protein